MKRITKDPNERKLEIIETSRALFIKKGFYQTRISDIVKSIGVAQGTFYHYFKSKDEVLDAIISHYIDELIQSSRGVVEDKELTSFEKLEKMAEIQLDFNREQSTNIHQIRGGDVHERVIASLVKRYIPLQAEVIREGIDEGVFEVDHPQLILEVITITANFIFDPGIFSWTKEELMVRGHFMIKFIEESLGVKEGSLNFYMELFFNNWK